MDVQVTGGILGYHNALGDGSTSNLEDESVEEESCSRIPRPMMRPS